MREKARTTAASGRLRADARGGGVVRTYASAACIGIGATAAAALCLLTPGITVTRVSPLFALATAGILAVAAVRRPRREGNVAALAIAVALLGLGDLSWAISDPTDLTHSQFPVTTDVFYVLGYGLLVIALATFSNGDSRQRDWPAEIDVAIVGLGIGLIAWLTFIRQFAESPAGRSSSGLIVPVAYGVATFALTVALVRMLFSQRRVTRFTVLLEAGVLSFLVSDALYARAALDGSWTTGSAIDAGWLVAYALWAAAALAPDVEVRHLASRRFKGFSFARWASLVTACLTVPGALMWSWWFGEPAEMPIIAAVSAALSVLWSLRVSMSLDALRRSLDARHVLERRLRDQALRDPLVGLANRTAFEHGLAAAALGPAPIAVLYLDLDDFKDVNDTLGHAAGDQVLVHVARRLRDALRSNDLAARLGGDEFAVLLPTGETEHAAAVATRVLDALREPIAVDGRRVLLHGTIGISIGAGRAPSDLMREADVAMYLAKGQGKNRVQVFEPSMHEPVMRRIALRSEMEQAIPNGEFVLHYQPIYEASLESIVACEALVRWQHPSHGLVAPPEFIGPAEETGLIVPLGSWVLRDACRTAAGWAGDGTHPAPAVAVNISAIQFEHPGFFAEVEAVIRETGLPPGRLILELTESTLLRGDDVRPLLVELRRIGVRLALDDFGTGYSSLAYLARFPIDILKIDRAFVAALGTGAREDLLTASIVNMTQQLSLDVVAEGVETEAQLARLRELGCGWIQGHLLARALPADLVAAELAARHGRPRVRPMRRAGERLAIHGTELPSSAA